MTLLHQPGVTAEVFLCSLQRSSPGQAPGARGPRAQGPRRRQEEAAGAGGGSRRRQQEEKAAPGEGAAADTALGTGTALGPLPAVSNTACPRLVLTSKSIFIDKRSRPLVRRLQRDTDESRSPLAAAANTKSNTLPLRAAEKKPSSAALPERPLHLHIAQTRWVTHACLGSRSMAPPLSLQGLAQHRDPRTPPSCRVGTGCGTHFIPPSREAQTQLSPAWHCMARARTQPPAPAPPAASTASAGGHRACPAPGRAGRSCSDPGLEP